MQRITSFQHGGGDDDAVEEAEASPGRSSDEGGTTRWPGGQSADFLQVCFMVEAPTPMERGEEVAGKCSARSMIAIISNLPMFPYEHDVRGNSIRNCEGLMAGTAEVAACIGWAWVHSFFVQTEMVVWVSRGWFRLDGATCLLPKKT